MNDFITEEHRKGEMMMRTPGEFPPGGVGQSLSQLLGEQGKRQQKRTIIDAMAETREKTSIKVEIREDLKDPLAKIAEERRIPKEDIVNRALEAWLKKEGAL